MQSDKRCLLQGIICINIKSSIIISEKASSHAHSTFTTTVVEYPITFTFLEPMCALSITINRFSFEIFEVNQNEKKRTQYKLERKVVQQCVSQLGRSSYLCFQITFATRSHIEIQFYGVCVCPPSLLGIVPFSYIQFRWRCYIFTPIGPSSFR